MLNVICNAIGGAVVGYVGVRAGFSAVNAAKATWVNKEVSLGETFFKPGAFNATIPFNKKGEVMIDEALWAPFWLINGRNQAISFLDDQGRRHTVYGPRHPRYLLERCVSSRSH